MTLAHFVRALGLCSGMLGACSSVFALPEFPAINKENQIRVFDSANNLEAPFLPAHRSTADGRVMVPVVTGFYFFLNTPEKIDKPFITSNPGTLDILASANGKAKGLKFDQTAIVGDLRTGWTTGMRSICDATSQFPTANSPTSPVSCGTAAAPVDCYKFKLIVPYSKTFAAEDRKRVEIWGRMVQVKVTNPKTPQAQLASYTWVGPAEKGLEYDVYDHNENNLPFAEPVFTNDGRLLVLRTGGAEFRDSGGNTIGNFNMVYSVAPESAAACDLKAFSALRPISHAPFDPDVKSRYGFAERQFRDPEGKLIPDNADFPGTYPWISRDGANLMFETLDTTLHNVVGTQVKTRYPVRCIAGVACNISPTVADVNSNGTVEWKGAKRGVSIAGRWTRGKIILLDGLVNNTDYALGHEQKIQREINLYAPNSGPFLTESGWVNAGFGQHNNLPWDLHFPKGMDMNTSLIDSMENLLNYRKSFTPVSFRDLVWLVTNGHTTAEVDFDEYVDASAYIVSNMSASLSFNSTRSFMTYRDGYDEKTGAFSSEKRVQNAATTTNFSVPSYGRIVGGARIEPIAMGGVEGRGLFIEGNSLDGIEYDTPASDLSGKDWTMSIFVDPRFADDTTRRRLFSFPDNTTVELVGLKSIRISKDGFSYQANVPGGLKAKAWNQIGLAVKLAGARADLYVNGFRTYVWNAGTSSVRLFAMTGASKLTVGVGAFRGWIDDFKVLAHDGNPEYMCNLAKGTLIGLTSNYTGSWKTVADSYATAQHTFVSNQIADTNYKFSQYACYRDYSGENLAHRLSIPANTVSVGQELHFPEGPLVFNTPRPDATANKFCLGCHDSGNSSESLRAAALGTAVPLVNMENDLRRQPMQPPRRVYGYIPQNFVGTGLPLQGTYETGGFEMDSLIYYAH